MRKPLKTTNVGDMVWLLPSRAHPYEISKSNLYFNEPLKVVSLRTIENVLMIQVEGSDRYFRLRKFTDIPP